MGDLLPPRVVLLIPGRDWRGKLRQLEARSHNVCGSSQCFLCVKAISLLKKTTIEGFEY